MIAVTWKKLHAAGDVPRLGLFSGSLSRKNLPCTSGPTPRRAIYAAVTMVATMITNLVGKAKAGSLFIYKTHVAGVLKTDDKYSLLLLLLLLMYSDDGTCIIIFVS